MFDQALTVSNMNENGIVACDLFFQEKIWVVVKLNAIVQLTTVFIVQYHH